LDHSAGRALRRVTLAACTARPPGSPRSDPTTEPERTTAVETEQLAARLQRREPEALEELFLAHGRRAFGLAYRILGDGSAAEDAVQDAFVAMWERAERIDPGSGRIESLLMTIVHRRAVDELRARSRRSAQSAGQPVDAVDESAAELFEGVIEALSSGGVRRRVRESLFALPPEQREAVELAYFDGLTHVQISETTGAPLGTVKSRLRLAMEKLRAALGIEGRA
jgi:RNA polymerase sigma-70 factor (ECF subfamily)